MLNRGVTTFYDEYVDRKPNNQKSYLGYFDVLLWEDLKDDLSACERLQRKPFYKIALLDGEANYYANGKNIKISGKHIVFTNPLTRSSFKTEDLGFTAIYCVFDEHFIKGTDRIPVEDWPVFRGKEIFNVALKEGQYNQLLQIFDNLREEEQSEYTFKESLIRNRIFDLIHYAQKIIDTPSTESKKEYIEDHFFKLLERTFLNINPKYPLEGKSPSFFAEKLSITTDRLNKTMKRVTGKTTQTLIHERIIEEANVLLKHTEYSIKEIAWILHFQETSHFLNFYKKYMCLTPLDYRSSK